MRQPTRTIKSASGNGYAKIRLMRNQPAELPKRATRPVTGIITRIQLSLITIITPIPTRLTGLPVPATDLERRTRAQGLALLEGTKKAVVHATGGMNQRNAK